MTILFKLFVATINIPIYIIIYNFIIYGRDLLSKCLQNTIYVIIILKWLLRNYRIQKHKAIYIFTINK